MGDRATTARCPAGHEWPALESFTHGEHIVCPAKCPECEELYVTLID